MRTAKHNTKKENEIDGEKNKSPSEKIADTAYLLADTIFNRMSPLALSTRSNEFQCICIYVHVYISFD